MFRLKHLILLLFCLPILSNHSRGQINLSGSVSDSDSDPVADVVVELIYHADTTIVLQDSTNRFGNYSIVLVSSADRQLFQNQESNRLYQNYPNPFKSSTVIQYEIPRATHVKIDIYNLQGQKIRTLLDAFQSNSVGQVEWDARNASGNAVASGVYIYSLVADGHRINKKMLLIGEHNGSSNAIPSGSSSYVRSERKSAEKSLSAEYLLQVSGEYIQYFQEEIEITADLTHDITVLRPEIDTPLHRFEGNPLIYQDMPGLEGELGANINGPSPIKVPNWLPNPLGKYYMYFAHHQGQYIRLAYADDPAGPWQIYAPGTLKLEETAAVGHIASPDVLLDDSAKTIRMYFHGPTDPDIGQKTYVSTSTDGVNFTALETQLGLPYFRVFKYDGYYYAIGKYSSVTGVLYRSSDGLTVFEEGPKIIPRIRHLALAVDGDMLYVFYSRIGDTPERILRSVVELDGDWTSWKASPPIEVLRPEETYEGADLPIITSRGGTARELLHQLRDPGLLIDEDGSYLYYSIAGEFGIAGIKFDYTSDSQ